MPEYHYIQSEPGLWTVGTGTPGKGGDWEPESDHDTPGKAAARVNFLNAGGRIETDEAVDALEEIAQSNAHMSDDRMEEVHGRVAMLMRRTARIALARIS